MNAGSSDVFRTEGIVAGYSAEVNVLSSVSIVVREREIVTVVGPNGAGKSTLLKTCVGLLNPKEGRIALHGRDITGLRPSAIARLGLGYVPQRENVFENMTVIENLEMGAAAKPKLPTGRRIAALFELFPRLAARRHQIVGTMSGGERQLVAIARALLPEPKILLLDEPSAGLAPILVEEMFEHIAMVNSLGVTILMVEQNARRALELSHRGYVLDLGTNALEGRGPDLVRDPRVAELYLG
jgi:branched-chain amino acid transport system ATP-binding protein